jgi:hypothetical protein
MNAMAQIANGMRYQEPHEPLGQYEYPMWCVIRMMDGERSVLSLLSIKVDHYPDDGGGDGEGGAKRLPG